MPSLLGRRATRIAVILFAGIGLALTAASPARAAETSNSEIVIVRQGDVVEDDLYAGAISVRVIGVIDGDLIAFAAEQVVIDGRVTGSVTVASPRVIVNGTVEGALRVVANDVVVNGSVGGDVVTAAFDVRLGRDSVVDGEVLAWVNEMDAQGTIGRGLSGSLRKLDLAGEIGGSVDVSVARLRVVDPLTVGGDLGYRSSRVADGLEKATVSGTVVQRVTLPPNLRVRALAVFARFFTVLVLTVAAVTTVWGWPERTARAAERVGVVGWRSWLVGASVFFSPLLVAVAAGLVISRAPPAAGLPLLALVVPLCLALLGLLMVVSLAAGVPVAARLGKLVFRRLGVHGSTLLGSVLLGFLWQLPWVGWLIPVVAMPLGLGSWILSRRRQEDTAASSLAG